jgi:hypothetical protein
MDVDIGLGDMDLDKPYAHNDKDGEIPLMGALARDSTDKEVVESLQQIKNVQGRKENSPEQHERYLLHMKKMTDRGGAAAGMFNALIATRPGTQSVKSGISKMLKTLRDSTLESGMAANSEMLTASGHSFDKASRLSLPPYLLRLEHLTPESDR